MLDLFMQQGSTFAPKIDGLVWMVTAIVGVFFILAEGMFFYLLFKYKKKDGEKAAYFDDHAEDNIKHTWIEWPHRVILVCDVALIVGAISVWMTVKLDMPETQETVRITAQQWAWVFHHAGPDGKLDTADDIRLVDELHVQVNKKYKFELTSRDVLHGFSVPVFRLKQDAIPGRVIEGWFEPTLVGEFDVQCTEICGIGHGIMPARLYVEDEKQHAAWLANPAPSFAWIH
jgi:cytochrome c oxidase subunit II